MQNFGNTDITLDGIAMTTSVKSQLTGSDGTMDIFELKRRIERKEADLKRKDRELVNMQRDSARVGKESKELQQRNEDLTRSLANARMLNASVLDDSCQAELRNQVSDLAGQLAVSEASVNGIRGELEALRAFNAGLEEGLEERDSTQEHTSHLHRTAMKDARDLTVKTKMLQAQLSDKEEAMAKLEKDMVKYRDGERRYKSMTEHQGMLLAAHDTTLVEQAQEIRTLKGSIQVRNETNSSLRNQVEELSDNNFILSKTEMDRLRKMEKDNESYATRTRDLVKSVELHMDLLQRAEAESAALRAQAEENSALVAEYKQKSSERVQLSESDQVTLKFLKKEVVKLRKENTDLTQRNETQVAELQALQSLRGGVAGAGMPNFRGNPGGAGAADQAGGGGGGGRPVGRSAEQDRQLRQAAEEATRALRNRMSFLLEQMEQASQLAASWQEQKAILKAEIGSLLRANHDLRERLVAVQRNFMGQALSEAGALASTGGQQGRTFMTTTAENYQQHEAAERLAEGLVALEQLGDSLQGPCMQPVPHTAEAMVERRLFDSICAFSSGRRDEAPPESQGGGKAKRRLGKAHGSFKVSQTADERVDIFVEDGDMDGLELLASLQIPAFLKFVQTRPADKLPRLFTEKMANVLNFSRRSVSDFLEQLGDARMQLGKLQAKVSVSWERVGRIRERCSKERLSKQKSVMRYIREQLRISDIRRILHDVGDRASEHVQDLDHSERAGLLGMRDQGVRDTMASLLQACAALQEVSSGAADAAGDTSSLAASAAVGALEIRLQDSQIDDETLHGVIGLLCGVLSPGQQDLGGSKKAEAYDGYHRMVEGEGGGAPIERNAGGGDLLLKSLGVRVSERQVAAANSIARSILSVRCDYTERILFVNLRGNALTDLSCKVLSAMVEKSSTLRMLDLRENLLSTTGAKFLFDATRRNITVLYVTQRQNGYMIEGHREILGSGGGARGRAEHGNTYESPGAPGAGGEAGDEDGSGSGSNVRLDSGEGPKPPLRIDMRNNNPSKEAVEELLESVQYRPAGAARSVPEGGAGGGLSLKSIVTDIRSFEDAYAGQGQGQGEARATRPSTQEAQQGSFTPAGLARNQFSGMLSTAQSGHVPPYGSGEGRRPQSAGGAGRGQAGAAIGAAVKSKLYSAQKQQPPPYGARDYGDEEDEEEDGYTGIDSSVAEMITNRKDREKGIVGVGGLIEQQIRRLQLTQPVDRDSKDPGRIADDSYETYSNRRKPDKAHSNNSNSNNNSNNSKSRDFATSGPKRQQEVVNAYSASMPGNRMPAHVAAQAAPRRNISNNNTAPARTAPSATSSPSPSPKEQGSGFVSGLRRNQSAGGGQMRPASASAGSRQTRKKSSSSKTSNSNAGAGAGTGAGQSSLPRVGSGGGSGGHHDALHASMNGYNLNPTLLF
jgi:hypothetical protein